MIRVDRTRVFRWSVLALTPLALAWLAMTPADFSPNLAGQVGYAVAADDDGEEVYVVGDGGNVFYVGGDKDQAYLGVQLVEETEHSEGGARVTRVVDDSPADEAGLREDDIVVGFGGTVIRGPVGLTKQIRAKKPGESVSLEVLRDGREMSFEVTLGDRSDRWAAYAPYVGAIDLPEVDADELRKQVQESLEGVSIQVPRVWSTSCDDDDEDCGSGLYRFDYMFGRPVLGVQLVETTPELRRHLGGGEDKGVLVSKVLDGTPAERAGIEVGDLIVAVDDDEISSSSDLRVALRDKEGESFSVEVIRGGKSMEIQVTIPDPDEDRPTGPRAYLLPAPPPAAPSAPHVRAYAVAPEAGVPVPVAPPVPGVEPVPISAPLLPAPPAPPAPGAPPAPRLHPNLVV